MMQAQAETATDQTCALRIRWVSVGDIRLDAGGKLRFPAVPGAPGLYRFRIDHAAGARSAYVGETDNLARRFAHYRNPGPTQATNLRLNALAREVLAAKATIAVDAVVDTAWLTIQGRERLADLRIKAMRRLFENMVQCVGGNADVETLNR